MSSNLITSRQHPLVKLCRGLHEARGRREAGLFLVEGRNAVGAALASAWPLRQVLATPEAHDIAEQARTLGISIFELPGELVAYASEAQSSVGVLAIADLPAPQTTIGCDGLTLILDGIGDPGNVGTLLRAADAAGAGAVILSEGSADAFAPKVVRSAAGSLFHLPPLPLPDRSPAAIIKTLAAAGIPLITAEAHHGADCYHMPWPARCALVLGHETRGVSPAFQAASRGKATIPVYGAAESLNAAMAGTLLLYAWRQAQPQR